MWPQGYRAGIESELPRPAAGALDAAQAVTGVAAALVRPTCGRRAVQSHHFCRGKSLVWYRSMTRIVYNINLAFDKRLTLQGIRVRRKGNT